MQNVKTNKIQKVTRNNSIHNDKYDGTNSNSNDGPSIKTRDN